MSGQQSRQVRVLIIGASGRMGRAIVRMAAERPDVRITGAIVPSSTEWRRPTPRAE